MIITVTTLDDQMFNLDVNEDMEISNFKVLCEAESGIKKQYMKLSCDGKELNGNSTLKNLGVRNGDMIVLIKIKPPSSTVSSAPNHG